MRFVVCCEQLEKHEQAVHVLERMKEQSVIYGNLFNDYRRNLQMVNKNNPNNVDWV